MTEGRPELPQALPARGCVVGERQVGVVARRVLHLQDVAGIRRGEEGVRLIVQHGLECGVVAADLHLLDIVPGEVAEAQMRAGVVVERRRALTLGDSLAIQPVQSFYPRSVERRVGIGRVSTWRYRWP